MKLDPREQPSKSTTIRTSPVRLRYVLLSIVLAAITAYVLLKLSGAKGSGNIVVVNAPEGPMKTRPLDPGGQHIPHRDKTVYELVERGTSHQEKQPVVERLLPLDELPAEEVLKAMESHASNSAVNDYKNLDSSSEQPDMQIEWSDVEKLIESPKKPVEVATSEIDEPEIKSEPRLEKETAQETKPEPKIETKSTPKAESKPVVEKSATKAVAVENKSGRKGPEKKAKPVVKEIAKAEAKPVSKPKVKKESKGSVKIKTSLKPADRFYVQIGSFKDEASAKQDVKRLRSKYAAALKDYKFMLRKATLGGRTVYRVWSTPMSKQHAQAAVAKFKAAGVPCFMTR